jgi:plasmid maintenance system antidote protein VapI
VYKVTRPKAPREAGRVIIADREVFGRQLSAAVLGRYGSVNAAAQDLGIPQPVLSRLINKKHISVTTGTWRRLEPLIGEDAAALLAILPPFAQRSQRAWQQWVEAESQRIISGASERVRRAKWRDLRALRVRMEEETALAYIVTKIGELQNQDRAELSRRRIFEPLLQAGEAGWIERNGGELTAAEFCRFVKAGWAREEILLRRENDLPRAQMSEALSLTALAARTGLKARVAVTHDSAVRGFRQHAPVTVRVTPRNRRA